MRINLYLISIALILAGCANATSPAPQGTPIDFSSIPSLAPTPESALTASPSPSATVESTPTITPSPTITPTQDYRTYPVSWIVTPPDPSITPGPTLRAFNGIPSNALAWDTYPLRYIDLAIPVPHKWLVRESFFPEDAPIYYGVLIIPDFFRHTNALALPEISLAVYRLPIERSLDDWFRAHSSTQKYDSAAIVNPAVYFYEVSIPQTIAVGELDGLRFTRQFSGLRVTTVLIAKGDTVASVSAITYDMTDLERVFEVMLTGIRPLNPVNP